MNEKILRQGRFLVLIWRQQKCTEMMINTKKVLKVATTEFGDDYSYHFHYLFFYYCSVISVSLLATTIDFFLSFVTKRDKNQKWLWQWSKTYIADSCKSYMRNYDWLCNRLQCLPLRRAKEKRNYLRLSLLVFFLRLLWGENSARDVLFPNRIHTQAHNIIRNFTSFFLLGLIK